MGICAQLFCFDGVEGKVCFPVPVCLLLQRYQELKFQVLTSSKSKHMGCVVYLVPGVMADYCRVLAN